MSEGPSELLRRLERGGTPTDALTLFDRLPPVTVADMLGSWRGHGIPTGHVLDGVLERYGWHGKRFEGPEDVHPLVFSAGGSTFAVNPLLLPVRLVLHHPVLARAPLLPVAFSRVAPLLSTTRPRARLRMTEFRGVVSATMVYDALPVLDVFRRVDVSTRLGVMDMRGLAAPYVFVLVREPDPDGPATPRPDPK